MGRNLKLEINYDGDVDVPDSGYDGWRLVSFGRKHSNYEDPAKYVKAFDPRTGEVTPANIGLAKKLNVGLAFWLAYYEHGLGRWSLKGEGPQCPWDSVPLAGVLLWTSRPGDIGAKKLEDRAEDARNFLESFNDWANGNCYWIRLSDENEEIESFGGLNGAEAVSAFVSDELRAGDSVRIIGDAAWLKEHLELPDGVTVLDEFPEPTAA
ncbi:MAG TPA: hypothetical protein VH592_10530 [Gemmataceae bacterium]|jgi:hypothetical protein